MDLMSNDTFLEQIFLKLQKFENTNLDEKVISDVCDLLLSNTSFKAEIEISIIEVAKKLGFRVYQLDSKNVYFTGFISVSNKYVMKFGSNKIICLNNEISYQQKRYIIAYLIADYVLQLKTLGCEYYNLYGISPYESEKEERIIKLADSLLMPEYEFRAMVDRCKNSSCFFNTINNIADIFAVPTENVKRRMKQLEIHLTLEK